LEIIMENMELTFGVIDLLDHNDRLYIAVWGDYESQFEFVAQYWCSETGKFTGTTRGGLKNPDDPALGFTESPAWDAFEAATGVTPEAFLSAFKEFIEDAAAREAAIIAREAAIIADED